MTRWKVIFFESGRKEKPVEKFIRSLNAVTIAKILRMLDLLEKYGPRLSMPHAKKIGSDIFELRIRGKEEIRVFYVFRNRDVYLLHAFKKKSNKTPSKELRTALARLDKLK
jgi:phage-related protein